MNEFRKFFILLGKHLKDLITDWKAIVAVLILLLSLYSSVLLSDEVSKQFKDGGIDDSIYDMIDKDFGSLNAFLPFALSVFLIPLVTLIISFDAIAAYRQVNTMRFYIKRVKRVTFLSSKILANFILLFVLLGLFFLYANIFFYYKLSYPININAFLFVWGLLSVYSLAFITFYTFISSLTRRTVSALMLCFLGLLFMLFVYSVPGLKFFSVFNFMGNFLKMSSSMKFNMLISLIGYSIIFYLLTWLKIERSDL